MKKTYLIGTVFTLVNLLNTSYTFSQDARFAQSYSNPLRLNPAIMGVNQDIKIGMNYRSQWAMADGGYKTSAFTAMYPFLTKNGKDKFDVGANIMNDKAGAFKSLDIALALGYCKELSPNNNVCLSFMAGYVQKSLNMTDQIFDNQYVNGSFNASNPTGELVINNKVSHPDLAFGFTWFYNPKRTESKLNAFMGVSGFHLNQANTSLMNSTYKLPMRFSYQAGITIFSGKKLDISPNVRVNDQSGNIEPAAGIYIDYHLNQNFRMVVGGWYRAHDAMAIMIGFDHKNYSIGYSSDLISSGLNNSNNDIRGNELTLSIKIRAPKRKGQVDHAEETVDENGIPIEIKTVYMNPFCSF